MVLLDLFPGGVLQLWDSLANGYWHARRLTFLMSGTFHTLEWLRMVADIGVPRARRRADGDRGAARRALFTSAHAEPDRAAPRTPDAAAA